LGFYETGTQPVFDIDAISVGTDRLSYWQRINAFIVLKKQSAQQRMLNFLARSA